MASLTFAERADCRSYAAELRYRGVVSLPPFFLFDACEIDRIRQLQNALTEEWVGVSHDVYVRRVLVDPAGQLPMSPPNIKATPLLDMFADASRKARLSEIVHPGSSFYVRRCQSHRMIKGSKIAKHIDADANPDYAFALVVQLGNGYAGGDFVTYPDVGREQRFSQTYGSVLIVNPFLRHAVTTVSENERFSLVCFYSAYAGPNRLQESVPTGANS